jgi:hypothetical protein
MDRTLGGTATPFLHHVRLKDSYAVVRMLSAACSKLASKA